MLQEGQEGQAKKAKRGVAGTCHCCAHIFYNFSKQVTQRETILCLFALFCRVALLLLSCYVGEDTNVGWFRRKRMLHLE